MTLVELNASPMAKFAQKLIEYSFYFLFFLVPLVFYSSSFELFEYNKMMLTYAVTTLIVIAWIIKLESLHGFAPKKWWQQIKKTPLDIPISLYLVSHLLSTVFSIDPHISLWGYYSRFHEGLLASFSYVLLYYAAVSNLNRSHVTKIFFVTFISSLIVSVWGIMEHFGSSLSCFFITGQMNNACWIQDVKNRVFATLGQPNWMAAYLNISILLLIGQATSYIFSRSKEKSASMLTILFYVITLFTFVSAFLFTKSRSGFLAIAAGLALFITIVLLKNLHHRQSYYYLGAVVAIIAIAITAFGLPFPDLEKYSLEHFLTVTNLQVTQKNPVKPISDGFIDIGVSESGDIRKIVWQGAIKIWQRYPILGSGVETYAYAYYKDRPVAHNMTSEWDFLYNKAHNEFLNVLATTGTVGMISYLSLIVTFILWFIKKSSFNPLLVSLFAAWTTIHITNFFGFSVVIIGLFFFLIPAFSFILSSPNSEEKIETQSDPTSRWIITGIVVVLGIITEINLLNLWRADKAYAYGKNLDSVGQYLPAVPYLSKAIALNPGEPTFKDEFSYNQAVLASALFQKIEESTASGIENLTKDQKLSLKFPSVNLSAQELMSIAIENSNAAVEISPESLPFWKTRTKTLYQLTTIDPNLLARSLEAIQKAAELAPTDAKVHYNLGLLLAQNGQTKNAITALEDTAKMKPDYRDAFYALGLYYNQIGEKEKSRQAMLYILTKIGPDPEAKKFLEEN